MKRILKMVLAILLIGSANTAFAQGWPWAVKSSGTGAEHSWGIDTDPAGNNYMVGDYSNGSGIFGGFTFPTISGTLSDAYVAKTNSSGTFLWAVYGGGSLSDFSNCVAATSTDVFVAGVYRSTATFNGSSGSPAILTGSTTDDECFIIRYNSAGVIQWAVKYTGVTGTNQLPNKIAINQTLSRIYVTGLTGASMFTNCYDYSTGALIWSTVTSGGSASGTGIVSDGSSSGYTYAVTQYTGTVTIGTLTVPGTNGAFLVKYDNTGTPVWAEAIAAGDAIPRAGLSIDGSGNLYAGGDFSGTVTFGTTPYFTTLVASGSGASRDIFIEQYNNAGTFQWAKRAGGTGTESVFAISTDAAGNSYIGANNLENNSVSIDCQTFPAVVGGVDNKCFVVCYNNTGGVAWAGAPVSDNDQTTIFGIKALSGGSAMVSGLTAGNTSFGPTVFTPGVTGGDAYIAKIGSSIPVISGVTICAGSTATLTPSSPTGPGFTCYWYSAAVGGTLLYTGYSYTTPALYSNTTYYLTVSPNGCASTRVPVTVTVNPLPTINVTGTSAICSGNCSTLSATGAAIYSWSPGGLYGTPVTVCPTGTTNYTVTGTDANTCTNTATFTVTVSATPTVTATAAPSTLTPPSVTSSFLSTTVSGGTGFTYSWSPVGSLSNPTIANPVATPTVTTTYTVTVTNANGCSATTTVTVYVTPQSLCNLTYDYDIPAGSTVTGVFPSMSGIGAKNIRITGIFTIDATFNFSQCNIEMEPNSRIQTTSGVVLYIAGGTHLYSCAGMWDGIYLVNGSSAQIVNASIIEDAEQGVQINQGASALIDKSIFNKNYTAVELNSNTSTISPLAMTGCVITSRDIPFTPVIVTNPSAATVWTNIIAGVYTSTNMKTPNYAYKSIYGVVATDVNALQVGANSGAFDFNGFDNLASTGIYLNRSNTTVYNNQFRNITNAYNCLLCTPLIGDGIYAYGNTATNYSLIVGGTSAYQSNTFTNVYTTVDATYYQTNNILDNTITNSSTATTTYGGFGKIGFKITPMSNNTINISGNTITNCDNGIWVNRTNPTSIQTVNLLVDNNSISANSSGFTTNGIYVTDYSGGTTLVPTTSEINNNVIYESANCINLSYVKTATNVTSNSCTVLYAAAPANINGIKAANCQSVKIVQNHTKYNVTTAGLPGGNITAYGIYLQNSSSMLVSCNLVEDAARSLVFDGACTSTNGILQNTMRRAQDGFVLLTSGTVVGQQGSASLASNNYWDLSAGMYFTHHVVNNATGTLILYMNATSGGPSQTTVPTIIVGFYSGTIITGSTPRPCGPVPAREAAPSETENTTPAASEPSMIVYPNPNNGSFTIETNSADSKDVFVYDMMGKLVFTLAKTTDATISVDISTLSKGLYFVKVQSGNTIQTQRILNQ